MGQSFVKNYIHLVFSTKLRQPFIDQTIEVELHRYLGGLCNKLDCQIIKVGGFIDHVHLLCLLSKRIALVHLVEELKTQSSKWIKTKGIQYKNFYWQNGYGVFSVTPSETDEVISYIANQHEHHSKMSFQTEFREILSQFNIEYDERYVWD
ncbi:MAG TPA: IS200/IS605 family transposase [Saprospiraceae bacterium]|nr:IS200/IS605 family transposase [Saprospiraceae bacterium]